MLLLAGGSACPTKQHDRNQIQCCNGGAFGGETACSVRENGYLVVMSRRDEWRKVLDSEVRRWSAMSCERLVSALRDSVVYEVEADSKMYQVEVELLKNTDRYVQVMVSVDDGSLPQSIVPASHSFICEKPPQTA